MATITTVGIGQSRAGVEVKIEARASTGRFTFAFEFEDQGSTAANEQQAYRELRTFLEETLAEMGNR